MKDVVIEFENVTKYYESHIHKAIGLKNYLFNLLKDGCKVDKKLVLSELNFTIKKGETVGFIGKNGAGKSTLLSLIAQVIQPSSGRITVNQRVSSLLELGAGFHPDLTGRENIELYGVVLGFTRDEIRAKSQSIIDYSDLDRNIDIPIRFYSSGMLARLGFSVISHLDPEILLVDEVLAVGDFSFRKKCEDTIQAFRKQNKTMIIVSHSERDIRNVCDRVIYLENSVIRMDGDPEKVLECYHNSIQS